MQLNIMRVMRTLVLSILLHTMDVSGREMANFPVAPLETMSVVINEAGRASLNRGQSSDAVAWGSFDDMIDKTGWAVLDVHTSPRESGERQSYAAGFLEGYLSHKRIAQHFKNVWGVDFRRRSVGSTPRNITQFVTRSLHWMQKQVQANPSDPYWVMVGSLLEQLRGLRDGYAEARDKEDKIAKHMWLPQLLDTDMDDLVAAMAANGEFPNLQDGLDNDWHRKSDSKPHTGHCSALVQVAPENADIWIGHTTWDAFRAMLRVIKYFDMPLPGTAARRVVFTSNPGCLYSGDDFYVTDAGLTVTETSLANYNKSLWQSLQPESMLTWVRAMAATRLATTGDTWTEMAMRHQMGLYNNQWMVLDYKRFTPGKPLRDGTLWVVESMPGHTERADVTDILVDQHSWPSYNIPYFHQIWTVAGYGEMQTKKPNYSDAYSFQHDVRARMFARARKHDRVIDLPSFIDVLRYNRRDDPLAKGDACNSISARCDLNPQNRPNYDCFGAIDGKVSRWRPDLSDLSFFAVSGPTRSNSARPFTWSEQNMSVENCKSWQHIGHPDVFDFPWYTLPSRYSVKAGDALRPQHAKGPKGMFFDAGVTLLFAAFTLSVGPCIIFLISRRGSGRKRFESYDSFMSSPGSSYTRMSSPDSSTRM